jgi:small subunit ribosomal protein S6
MLNYEACLILNPQLPDQELDGIIEKLKNQLVSAGAKLQEVARWGRRRLGFEIGKVTEGFYVVYFFNLDRVGDALTNLERTAKYDDNILRCMIVNVPVKKKGQEVKQIVPQPGWLSEFSMRLRPHAPRRREGYGRGPRPPMERREETPPPAAEAPSAPAPEASSEE